MYMLLAWLPVTDPCHLLLFFPHTVKAYFILDELVVGGEIQETSKKNIVRAITAQDMLQEVRLV